MEASRERKGGDEVLMRRLHIVYFLSRKGKIEQPHLITVHHLNNNGVLLRDFKRWLSELRGKEMPESFAWSYKRKYKTGYIWQDLTDDDLIIPTSYCEYVLKGSLLSPIKIIEKLKEEAKSLAAPATLRTTGETLQREKTTSKPPTELEEQSPAETSNSSSEEAQRKTAVFRIDSWKEEMKRVEKLSCEEIVPMENGRQLTQVKSKESGDNKARSWAPFVLRDFLSCRTVGTKDSIMKAVSNQNQSGSRRNNSSST
ncbi:hypothetical protein IEQ34_002793 [Dendrobium chrysotoxum]|uniref:SOSEKI DIX-like domain-containing protein n=1 Tax=Dendrobium chrysotoxum TaxID=161865 RepID=A0AAV7H0Z5_DENCH|nr:hypothetical protein IEQ34_002793 [Dendrobium chrysotoxum]